MLEEMQAVRDAAGNGALHPVVAAALEDLDKRVRLLETPADDPAPDTAQGGE